MKELELADGVRSAKQDGSVHRWFDLDRGADLSTSSGLGLSCGDVVSTVVLAESLRKRERLRRLKLITSAWCRISLGGPQDARHKRGVIVHHTVSEWPAHVFQKDTLPVGSVDLQR